MTSYRHHLLAVLDALEIEREGSIIIPSQRKMLVAMGSAQIFMLPENEPCRKPLENPERRIR